MFYRRSTLAAVLFSFTGLLLCLYTLLPLLQSVAYTSASIDPAVKAGRQDTKWQGRQKLDLSPSALKLDLAMSTSRTIESAGDRTGANAGKTSDSAGKAEGDSDGSAGDVRMEIFIMSHCPDAEYAVMFLHGKVLPSFPPQPLPQSSLDAASDGAGVGTTLADKAMNELRAADSHNAHTNSQDIGSSTEAREGGRSLRTELQFITNPDGSCKHGPLECDGNRLLLSVQYAAPLHGVDFLATYISTGDLYELGTYPSSDLDRAFKDPRSGPLTAAQRRLALATFTNDDRPSDGDETVSEWLLRKSADRARALGVQYSATVAVDGEIIAVRDDGAWKANEATGLGDDPQVWIDYLRGRLAKAADGAGQGRRSKGYHKGQHKGEPKKDAATGKEGDGAGSEQKPFDVTLQS